MASTNSKPGPKPKVAKLIEKYDLEGIGDELEAKWTDPDVRQGLRALATLFNQRLLATALRESTVDTLSDDVSRLLAVLQGDEGSSGERTQLKRRLERDGVDVEDVIDDFVTYQAIRTYLTSYRNAELPNESDEAVREKEAEAITQLRKRAETVTDSKIERLHETDRLQLGPHQILTDIRVLCETCGKQYDPVELLEDGACQCYRDENED